MYATGARPNLFLVLLAYAVSQILVVVPITPGGLGFVEVGLVGFLRFAGLDPAAALGATLAYRLFSYWLPLPVGAAAYGLYVHRYHRKVSPGAVYVPRPGEEGFDGGADAADAAATGDASAAEGARAARAGPDDDPGGSA